MWGSGSARGSLPVNAGLQYLGLIAPTRDLVGLWGRQDGAVAVANMSGVHANASVGVTAMHVSGTLEEKSRQKSGIWGNPLTMGRKPLQEFCRLRRLPGLKPHSQAPTNKSKDSASTQYEGNDSNRRSYYRSSRRRGSYLCTISEFDAPWKRSDLWTFRSRKTPP